MDEWISAQDRLPERTRCVLVWEANDGVVSIAAFQGDGHWSGDSIDDDCEITHWMPLPGGPAGRGKRQPYLRERITNIMLVTRKEHFAEYLRRSQRREAERNG